MQKAEDQLSSKSRDPKQVLKEYWNFSEFRPFQEEIIQSVLDGKDTLALLPTGGGKSICYQVPALATDGICIVVSPLIALMKDQVMNLKKMGVKVAAIYAGMSYREIDITLDNCIYGGYKLLYLSPERLLSELVRSRLEKMPVSLLAVDEAHCISQWGYDFRPAYLSIVDIRPFLGEVPVLALTASATKRVKTDIMEQLKFREDKVFQESFERKNISYAVRYEDAKFNKLVRVFSRVNGSGIVYVRNRKKTRDAAEYLARNGITSDYYHAGLDMESRTRKQKDWLDEKIRVMVCTNAFGMGIDKPNVRCVVHLDLPENIESYYQEAGRAGRDGKKSYALLLFNLSDKVQVEDRIQTHFPSSQEVANVYNALCNYLQVAVGSGEGQSHDFDIREFCNTFLLEPVKVHHSLRLLEQHGLIINTEAVFIPSKIKIIVNKETLYKFQIANPSLDGLIKFILRTHPGVFDEFIPVNEKEIAKNLGWELGQLVKALEHLTQLQYCSYEKLRESPMITFAISRSEPGDIALDNQFIRRRKDIFESQLKSILGYAMEKSKCRSEYILNYFGENSTFRCGTCDICIERNKLGLSDLEYEQIVAAVQRELGSGGISVQQLMTKMGGNSEERVFQTLKWLMDSGQVVQYDDNQLFWSE